MLVVVETPLTRIHMRGQIPKQVVTLLRKQYGNMMRVTADEGDELVDVFQTGWYKRVKRGLTPGKNLRLYRQNMGLTQEQLGAKLGKLPKQYITNMENGVRPISKQTALRLARLFGVSVAKFIG